ncbi:hypothetical protein VZC37_06325 [Gordonia sp. LSe1-13]|uniref:Integral membrane protein n=1 Tax=Gordonia sesuvii TaxID=3116777 RepID=A0ABU7MA00_9ACTN|nr:hypothetical protein [Gordonia sp. LSe1-13]
MTTPQDPQNPGPPDPDQGGGGASGPNPEYPNPEPSAGGTPPPSYPPPGSVPPPPPGPSGPPPPSGYPPPGSYPPPGGSYPPPGPPPSGPPPGYGAAPGYGSQPGGYPPPPGPGYDPGAGAPGGYPPPPGNYGEYGAGGYGAPSADQFSIGEAFSYGWNRYKENAVSWIVLILIGILVSALISWLNQVSSDGGRILWIGAIFSIISTIVGYIFQGAWARGALDEVSGSKPAIGRFFDLNFAAVIITAFLVGLGTFIGLILLIIPGIVFAFLAYWSLTFVVDRDMDPIEGIKASFSVISKNAGTLFLLALAVIGLNLVGALLCLVGLLVTIPVTTIATTYAYRYFTGGQIAPVASAAPMAPPPYPPNQY